MSVSFKPVLVLALALFLLTAGCLGMFQGAPQGNVTSAANNTPGGAGTAVTGTPSGNGAGTSQSGGSPAVAPSVPCNRQATQELKDQCYYALALRTGNVTMCDVIAGETTRNSCYGTLSPAYWYLAGCEKISNDTAAADACYLKIAEANKDDTVCGRMQSKGGRNGCYFSIAIAKPDEKVCGYIIGDDLGRRDACFGAVARRTLNAPTCQKMGGSVDTQINQRNQCYYDIALATGDKTLCNRIINDASLVASCQAGIK